MLESETIITVRRQLHGVAEGFIAGPQYRAAGTIRLADSTGVSGANVKPWITDGHLPPSLRRLQSEMQMLLYNHPVNDARMAQGRLTVNSFWVHGAGALPKTHAAQAGSEVTVLDHLREAAVRGDLQAWLAAWQQVDAEHLAPLAQHSGLRLTLCSETSAHTYQRTERSWLQRLGAAFHKTDTGRALQALIPT